MAILRLVFLPYFSRILEYDNFTTRISPVFLSYFGIRPFYDSYFSRILEYDNFTIHNSPYFGIRPFYNSYFSRIRQFYDSYFFRYDFVFPPYFFWHDNSTTRIIPYNLHTGILWLVFLLIPAVILQYYLVFESPTARIFSEEYEHAFGFRILRSLFSLVW